MGKLTVEFPEDFITQLERMGDLDRVAPKMLDAAMEPTAKAIRKNLRRHVETGKLLDSVAKGQPKKKKDVWQSKITFTGYDKTDKPTPKYPRGKPNAIKAVALEYGTSDQNATPFLRPAIIETEEEAVAKMQDLFDFEMDLKKL